VFVGADGETYVGVWVDAPETVPGQAVRSRPPMALSLVVDVSGSMSGAKIQNARVAASSLLESLTDGDIVSIYAFNNGVTEIAPPTQVNQATRPSLMQRVQYLHAGGGTNMFGGVSTGISRVSQAPQSHSVRRVVLISDGHANVGPSDPGSLGTLAGNGTEYGVQVSAIGVGLDYDESTLGALAVQSSGRLYHLEQPYQMAQILEQEIQLLASTIATDAYIEVVPAPGVRILEGVSTGAQVLPNGRLRVPLGSVYAGQRRDVLFRAQVQTNRPGERQLATAQLVYRAPDAAEEQVQRTTLRYEVTRNRGAVQQSATPRVQAMVANFEAARAQRAAAEALNRGDRAEAERQYEFADDAIQGALAAPMPAAERQRLEETRTRVNRVRSRARRATTAREARGAALESFDAAMEAEGY
ncbi:MAG TPA: VWA domain-containing protein, partial [Polyangiaceae bacterium LLY-WYZ-15_(1-7)]|nr:VWA domain-containing protein [Polyangiaceae bacterium LLY-WYZ-15_(1-7)]